MMRTVFHRHAPGDMWIGSFIPEKEDYILEIKRNICRVILSSRTADNTRHKGNPLLWPFQCFLGPNGRLARGQANSNSTDNWQPGKKDLEECIPLRTNNQPICLPVVDEDSPVKDG
uniref:Uncharacterized protein n=1 Tax=Knipowitschia caucasica TaxID=637954 RepID=A0AAV2KXV3_KNICA